MAEDPFCAEVSEELDEPLAGTAAADTDVWLMLEHEGPWGAKPLASEGLSDRVRGRLEQWLDAVPRSRLQLIRRPERRADDATVFFVGSSADPEPWLLRFELPDPEAVADLDLPALLRDRQHPAAVKVDAPLHLVCTHGKRDRCCAKWGMATYQTLDAADSGHVWQTSHTGGHRFAANVLSFPYGISYGRVTPEEAGDLVRAHRAGRMHALERSRGRTCFDAPTQTAELLVRRELQHLALDGVGHVDTEARGHDRWLVRLEIDGRELAVEVTRHETDERRPKSCGDPPAPVERYDGRVL